MTLKEAVLEYLAALSVMQDMADRGQDDSGKRESPSYAQWLAADCRYTEALDCLKKKSGYGAG